MNYHFNFRFFADESDPLNDKEVIIKSGQNSGVELTVINSITSIPPKISPISKPPAKSVDIFPPSIFDRTIKKSASQSSIKENIENEKSIVTTHEEIKEISPQKIEIREINKKNINILGHEDTKRGNSMSVSKRDFFRSLDNMTENKIALKMKMETTNHQILQLQFDYDINTDTPLKVAQEMIRDLLLDEKDIPLIETAIVEELNHKQNHHEEIKAKKIKLNQDIIDKIIEK